MKFLYHFICLSAALNVFTLALPTSNIPELHANTYSHDSSLIIHARQGGSRSLGRFSFLNRQSTTIAGITRVALAIGNQIRGFVTRRRLERGVAQFPSLTPDDVGANALLERIRVGIENQLDRSLTIQTRVQVAGRGLIVSIQVTPATGSTFTNFRNAAAGNGLTGEDVMRQMITDAVQDAINQNARAGTYDLAVRMDGHPQDGVILGELQWLVNDAQ